LQAGTEDKEVKKKSPEISVFLEVSQAARPRKTYLLLEFSYNVP
jgi:hypothetical protein